MKAKYFNDFLQYQFCIIIIITIINLEVKFWSIILSTTFEWSFPGRSMGIMFETLKSRESFTCDNKHDIVKMFEYPPILIAFE